MNMFYKYNHPLHVVVKFSFFNSTKLFPSNDWLVLKILIVFADKCGCAFKKCRLAGRYSYRVRSLLIVPTLKLKTNLFLLAES